MPKKNDFIFISGNSNILLASDTANYLNMPVYFPVTRFANEEAHVQIPVNVRHKTVVIFQSTCPPHIDNDYLELFLLIDAARRASAKDIIVVIPHFGYARQDRKDKPRVPISSSLIAKLIESAGASRICTLDIHSDQQQGSVKIPWDNVYGSFSLIPLLRKMNLENLVLASPDKGGVLMATAYAQRLSAQGLAIVFKERDVNLKNASKAMDLIGEVQNKSVILVDDIIDTAGTLCNAAKLIKERGAKRIIAAASHGIFSQDALQKIEDSPIEQILVTDSIDLREKCKQSNKIKVVSIAPLMGEAINCIYSGESISEKLILRNW